MPRRKIDLSTKSLKDNRNDNKPRCENECSNICDKISSLEEFIPQSKGGSNLQNNQDLHHEYPMEHDDKDATIISAITKIHDFCGTLMKEVERLSNENTKLKKTVKEISSKLDKIDQPAPVDEIIMPELNDQARRLDQLEQNGLETVIKIEGKSFHDIFELQNRKPQFFKQELKERVTAKLRVVAPDQPAVKSIRDVKIVGKNKPHLKVTMGSVEDKVSILKYFKAKKPINSYINEYLTRSRAELMRKLRQMKKRHAELLSVFVLNGSIFYKLRNDSKKYQVYGDECVNKLREFLGDR